MSVSQQYESKDSAAYCHSRDSTKQSSPKMKNETPANISENYPKIQGNSCQTPESEVSDAVCDEARSKEI